MRSSTLALAAALGLAVGAAAGADPAQAPPAGEGSPAAAAAPAQAPGEAAPAAAAAPAEAAAEPERAAARPAKAPIELGPVGHDAQGNPGRLHVVTPGNTLWDISDAYLGTPWVWPSIWKANEGIANPHRIFPGDRIWITPNEMRRVSEAEAAALLAGQPGGEVPAALDVDGVPGDSQPRVYRFTGIQTSGFVSEEELAGAAAIVDSPVVERNWFGDHDEVVIGLGEGATRVGDQFEIFRQGEQVSDPESDKPFGWATEELGWLEVVAVHPESATAVIRLSSGEIHRGDRLLPRPEARPDIVVRSAPAVEGRVVFTPDSRLNMGGADVVYLDRGTGDGLEVGSPLEVFRVLGQGDGVGVDAAREEAVRLPDAVVAKLLVVEARDHTAVAVVTYSLEELNRGDRFRGTDSLAR
jgi:hypothetical protein